MVLNFKDILEPKNIFRSNPKLPYLKIKICVNYKCVILIIRYIIYSNTVFSL